MKILVMAPQPFYVERGTPIAIHLLLQALCGAGHEVDLLTFAQGEDVDIAGLRIHRIRRLPFVRKVPIGFSVQKLACDFLMAVKAFGMLRRNDYQAVHAVEESVFIAALLPRRGARLVYDMDSSMADQLVEKWRVLALLGSLFNRAERFAVRRADVILPVCQALADKIGRYTHADRIFVLNDVALEAADPAGEIDDLRELTGSTGPLALYVGNLEHYQGMDLLLEAMQRLDGGQPLQLVAIGGRPEDVERYRIQARQAGLEGVVHFLGPRPIRDLPRYLEQADILVSPRIKGSNTPMKIYSYLASGMPVLATAIDSHTQVLDPAWACLVDAEAGAMAKGLERLATDPDLRARIGTAGRERALKYHTVEAFREQLATAYRQLESL